MYIPSSSIQELMVDAVHSKNTARLVFRPRSVRPKIDLIFPEERSVSLSLLNQRCALCCLATSSLPSLQGKDE